MDALLIKCATRLQKLVDKTAISGGVVRSKGQVVLVVRLKYPQILAVPPQRCEVDVTSDETNRSIPTPTMSDRRMTLQKASTWV